MPAVLPPLIMSHPVFYLSEIGPLPSGVGVHFLIANTFIPAFYLVFPF